MEYCVGDGALCGRWSTVLEMEHCVRDGLSHQRPDGRTISNTHKSHIASIAVQTLYNHRVLALFCCVLLNCCTFLAVVNDKFSSSISVLLTGLKSFKSTEFLGMNV